MLHSVGPVPLSGLKTTVACPRPISMKNTYVFAMRARVQHKRKERAELFYASSKHLMIPLFTVENGVP